MYICRNDRAGYEAIMFAGMTGGRFWRGCGRGVLTAPNTLKYFQDFYLKANPVLPYMYHIHSPAGQRLPYRQAQDLPVSTRAGYGAAAGGSGACHAVEYDLFIQIQLESRN